jgi:hypothetical protein
MRGDCFPVCVRIIADGREYERAEAMHCLLDTGEYDSCRTMERSLTSIAQYLAGRRDRVFIAIDAGNVTRLVRIQPLPPPPDEDVDLWLQDQQAMVTNVAQALVLSQTVGLELYRLEVEHEMEFADLDEVVKLGLRRLLPAVANGDEPLMERGSPTDPAVE